MILWKELIGYLGMAFIVLSFSFKNIRTLRTLNLIGAVACLIYGLVTQTPATAALNAFCIIINITQLIKQSRAESKSQK